MTPFYGTCRTLSRILLCCWRFEVIGAHHIPLSGPVIVACNHVSYFDPVVLGVGAPRMLTYLAKKQLFDIPILGAVVRGCGAYPLDREAGGVAALRTALRVLAQGRCVGIFPEGTRNIAGTAKEKGGAAFLAALSGAPVVPAAIVGTHAARRLAHIRVAYGEPLIIVRNRKADGHDLEKWTSEIMRRIRMLEESIGGD